MISVLFVGKKKDDKHKKNGDDEDGADDDDDDVLNDGLFVYSDFAILSTWIFFFKKKIGLENLDEDQGKSKNN